MSAERLTKSYNSSDYENALNRMHSDSVARNGRPNTFAMPNDVTVRKDLYEYVDDTDSPLFIDSVRTQVNGTAAIQAEPSRRRLPDIKPLPKRKPSAKPEIIPNVHTYNIPKEYPVEIFEICVKVAVVITVAITAMLVVLSVVMNIVAGDYARMVNETRDTLVEVTEQTDNMEVELSCAVADVRMMLRNSDSGLNELHSPSDYQITKVYQDKSDYTVINYNSYDDRVEKLSVTGDDDGVNIRTFVNMIVDILHIE